ncbi:OLC1v1024326C1 [Oldenlandia corymbosa var. corymbosa]|uniref:OLC1v1024326C1 n=1 Tax=Oldenlandia corymbosa var. corymbosa TaxID=529605 RepID=A0AAV1C2Z3_OLDCO|nr:OLC1v1024326C1 [Oldenlandia corymbosa var. corymbosa]
MSKLRVLSSPLLAPSSPSSSSSSPQDCYDDSALEGVAANVKLLLKLIQDHKDACYKHKNDGRRMLRVATMMTILDNVRNRIQKCQFGNKRSEAELRRCNTDPKPQQQVHSPKTPPTDPRRRGGGAGGGGDESSSSSFDEHEKLKKAFNASLAARKSLEIMCSSLGKEKEIMSAELAKKVHEVNEMDEMINDLRAQNETLSEKLKQYASEPNREKRMMTSEAHGNAILQERNRALSDHLQRSLDGYRSLKRKLREAVEENLMAQSTMEEMVGKVKESLTRFRSFKGRIAADSSAAAAIEAEIVHLEEVFDLLQMKVATTKIGQNKKIDYGKQQKSETAISRPYVAV